MNERPALARLPAVNVEEVLATINRARAAYGAAQLEHLPSGLRRNPSHCPLARAFRLGVSDRFFFAVGSRHLRVEALDQDPARIAYAISTAWYGPPRMVEGNPVNSVIRMPSELCTFVEEFDAGALPEYVGAPESNESATVAALANRLADAKAMKSARRSIISARSGTIARELQNLDERKAVRGRLPAKRGHVSRELEFFRRGASA